MTEFKELNFNTLTTDQLSNYLDEWDKKIVTKDSEISIVDESLSAIRKDLVDAREKLNDLRKKEIDSETIIKKGYQVKRKLTAEKNMIDRAYWRNKR